MQRDLRGRRPPLPRLHADLGQQQRRPRSRCRRSAQVGGKVAEALFCLKDGLVKRPAKLGFIYEL